MKALMRAIPCFLAGIGALCLGVTLLAQDTKSEPASTPPPPLPTRVRVSQKVSQGLILKKVQPSYPLGARDAHIQGSVVMKAVIGKTGDIEELELISGHPALVPAAMKAVKKWKYRPYLLQGRPVEVETQITVIFTLSGG